MPTVSVDVVKVAAPCVFKVPVPSCVVPSKKVAVPPGVPPAEVTVAVNVADCPTGAGFSPEVSVVAVSALFTVCCTAEEVLVA